MYKGLTFVQIFEQSLFIFILIFDIDIKNLKFLHICRV